MSYITLATPVSLSGPSLLSSKSTTVTISPADKGAGFERFRRPTQRENFLDAMDSIVP